MINYEELLNNGFGIHGNWYVKGGVSINLFAKVIKSNNYSNCEFSYIFKTDMTINKINEIYEMISSLQ